MKLSVVLHVALQGLALVVQYANLATTAVPPKYQPIVAGVVAIAQAILGMVAHYSTPPNAK